MLVLVDQVHSGIYMARCNRCGKDVGTFDIDGLRVAIEFGKKLGGLLCPRCRSQACVRCGIVIRNDSDCKSFCSVCFLEVPVIVWFIPGDVTERVRGRSCSCWVCVDLLYLNLYGKVSSPCLVLQNSTELGQVAENEQREGGGKSA